MRLHRRALIASLMSYPCAHSGAQAAPALKIGVLGDQSGPYRDFGGPLSVACVRQAIADFSAAGLTVDVVVGDHQNKPDIGTGIARQWFDQDGVDAIVDVPHSGVALAVSSVAREKDKLLMVASAGTVELTGSQCSPNTLHITYDTYMLARSTVGALVQSGDKTWFFITADYTFGHDLERDSAKFVEQGGGKVLGRARTPFPGTTDFSSYLVQAQTSGAQVVGLANAGADTINCIKQAAEFGIGRSARLAGLLVYISDVHAIGLPIAGGLLLTETFYWDLNDRTRAFTQRLLQRREGARPGMSQAGAYAATLHWLKAAHDMGAAKAKASGRETVARMKAMPMDDDVFGPSRVREDGVVMHPAHLFQVKTPAESKSAWDYYKLLSSTPAEAAFKPLAETGCALVHI